MKKVVNAIAQGMSKDADIGIVKPSLLFDARNIRLTAREGSTLLSITNERSTKEAKYDLVNDVIIEGTVLGYCILNENLIIFHTDTLYSEDEPPVETKTDYISVIEKDDSGYYTRKYAYGDLNFGNKIEAFGLYETANLKKVYWTDGVNQPRMFNIALLDNINSLSISPNDIDFSPELNVTTAIPTITKNDNAGGLFPAGVIQYVFTYYNVNGLLSAPFYVSPLHYITFANRAGSPEETCNCTFTIQINNTVPNNQNLSWDYIRIYRLVRTSINNTPLVEYLPDIKNSLSVISVIDNGVNSTAVTSTDLYYLGGDVFTCRTFTNKDAVLFCGNLEIETPIVSNPLVEGSSSHKNFEYTLNYHLRTVGTAGTENTEYKRLTVDSLNIDDYNYDSENIKKIKVNVTDIHLPGGALHAEGMYHTYNDIKEDLLHSQDENMCEFALWYDNTSSDPVEILAEDLQRLLSESLTAIYDENPRDWDDVQVANAWNNVSFGGKYTVTAADKTLLYTLIEGTWTTETISNPVTNYFNFELDKSQDLITYFRYGEFYRFGVQFKDKYGLWSNVVYLDDKKCDLTREVNSATYPAGVVPSVSSDYPYLVSEMLIGLNFLLNNDIIDNYVAARPVCVYPDITNMRVVALGILCPTLSKMGKKEENINYLSDWFARPSSSNLIQSSGSLKNPQMFSIVGTKRYPLGEIQIPADFSINRNICTIHSPEFEFDESVGNLIESCTLCKMGTVKVLQSLGKIDFTYSNPSSQYTEKISYSGENSRLINYSGFIDSIVSVNGSLDEANDNTQEIQYSTVEIDYVVYPWSSESLSLGTSLLRQKWFSNIHRCGSINYYNTSAGGPISLYNETHNDITYTAVPKFVNTFNDLLYNLSPFGDPSYYKANINQVLTPETSDNWCFYLTKIKGHKYTDNVEKILFNFANVATTDPLTYPKLNIVPISGQTTSILYIPTYSSTSSTDTWSYTSSNLQVLKEKANTNSSKGVLIKYKSSNHVIARLNADLNDNTDSDLYILCDLIRETAYHQQNKMDNDSEAALLNNTWIPCGEEVPISSSMTLHCTKGDTYYQRYEHLKTYPYDDSSMNNVVEIVSFPVETRINIQGRYDKRINITDHLYTNPTNFNLLNDVYSQKDNFFTYRTLDEDLFNTKVFPNQVVFSLKKNLGERIDTWTNISLASTLDLDGDKGELTALRRWLNKLLFFLKHGYGIIDYNERTVLNTSEGLPVLIANSGKVDGKIYLSTIIGCDKKETIVEGYDGLYFTDNSLKSVYLLSDIQGKPTSLTDTLGMKSWMFNKEINRSYYDTNYKDLYLMTDDDCLGYSEPLKQFTSFYDYKDADFLVNLDKEFIASANVTTTENDNTTTEKKLWELFKGTITENSITKPSYNKLFNINRDYLITYRINGLDGATNNKIFDYIEYKGDIIDSNKATIDAYPDYQTVNKYDGLNRLFSKILVSNEYLDTGNVNINGDNTRKKFRVWRTIIPRNYNSRTRISNPWVYIKLTGGQLKLLVLHDMNVYYND